MWDRTIWRYSSPDHSCRTIAGSSSRNHCIFGNKCRLALFQLRYNMQKIFTKAFDSARMEYSTMLDTFETTYHKPGGTICGALGQIVHRLVDSGRDDTGCGRWSYLSYAAKEGKKVAIFLAYRACK
jgi:hypothetical protein